VNKSGDIATVAVVPIQNIIVLLRSHIILVEQERSGSAPTLMSNTNIFSKMAQNSCTPIYGLQNNVTKT
jgi:hypothetical protein